MRYMGDEELIQLVMEKVKVEMKKRIKELKKQGVEAGYKEEGEKVAIAINLKSLYNKMREKAKLTLIQKMQPVQERIKFKTIQVGNEKVEIATVSILAPDKDSPEIQEAITKLEQLKSQHPIDYQLRNGKLTMVVILSEYYKRYLNQIIDQLVETKNQINAYIQMASSKVPDLGQLEVAMELQTMGDYLVAVLRPTKKTSDV
jgi:tRNA/tmRNA/rRNA uracil-C5-methylase (TrmA/RlmC/RlmD family)